jgi:hypothetical protein
MAQSPHDRLAAGVAAGRAPTTMDPGAPRRALTRWIAWCAARGRDPGDLSAAADFLADRLEAERNPRTAHIRFAHFQIAAALVWGPLQAAPLAQTLRAARMTRKPAPADRWARAAVAVAGLPDEWRAPFEALLAASRTKPRGAPLIWSAARIASVASALRKYRAARGGVAHAPTAGVFAAWAAAMTAKGVAPMSVAAYLGRVIAGFEKVLTPGVVHDGPAAIADRWSVRARRAPRRRSATRRTLPASAVYDAGCAMIAEAEAAPVRRIGEAMLCRDGLLLAQAAALPERARALAALAFGSTLFLEEDGFIRYAIPGEALKRAEGRKGAAGFHARFRNPRLHRALTLWRTEFRPMFDDGAWLFASTQDHDHPLTATGLANAFRRATAARLGRKISIHDIRGCAASEIIETDPVKGPARASAVLRHRDPAVTREFYDRAEGLVACAGWEDVVARRAGADRPDLDLGPDPDPAHGPSRPIPAAAPVDAAVRR